MVSGDGWMVTTPHGIPRTLDLSPVTIHPSPFTRHHSLVTIHLSPIYQNSFHSSSSCALPPLGSALPALGGTLLPGLWAGCSTWRRAGLCASARCPARADVS